MIYTKDQIISAIDAVIDGDSPLLEWDYFVGVKHKDPLVAYWSAKAREIEKRYRGADGSMITEDGVAALRKVREEICNDKKLR